MRLSFRNKTNENDHFNDYLHWLYFKRMELPFQIATRNSLDICFFSLPKGRALSTMSKSTHNPTPLMEFTVFSVENKRGSRISGTSEVTHISSCLRSLDVGKCFHVFIYRERVCLFPRNLSSPGDWSHFLRKRFRNSHQDEADVQEGHHGGHQHHKAVPISGRKVCSNGRAADQTSGRCGWDPSVSGASLVLLGNVSDIGDCHREGNGEDSRHRNHCKIPPRADPHQGDWEAGEENGAQEEGLLPPTRQTELLSALRSETRAGPLHLEWDHS